MKVADLSNETLAKIKIVRWDRIIEKHEGPETWESEWVHLSLANTSN
jgi:hypothetical protein